ncbi:MAG: STAS domain-containing protein [Solirubrobacterales bacterium]|nr:STAS domain-containing protein [Solirubrobacterales bacterium]
MKILLPDGFEVTSEREGSQMVIRVVGEIDLATAPHLQRHIDAAQADDVSSVVLDIDGVTFIDSTGVRLVITAQSHARAARQDFALRRVPSHIRRLLALIGVADRFRITD